MARTRAHTGEPVGIVEIIEVSASPAPRAPRDVPQRRVRPAVVAVVGAVVLVVAAVVTVLAWPEPDRPRAPTTEPQRFDVDAPPGWSAYAANMLSPADRRSWFGLWTTPAADRWVLVETVPAERPPEALVGAARSYVGQFEAATPQGFPERRRVEIPLGRVRAVVTASGWDGRALVAFLQGVRPPVDDEVAPVVPDPEGMTLAVTGPSLDAVLYGRPVGEVVYRNATTGDDVVFTFGQAAADDRALGDTILRTVGRDPARNYLRVERDDGVVFTFEGAVDDATLGAFSARVQQVDDATWQRLLYSRRPGLALGELVQIGDGRTTGGHLWTAGLRLARDNGEQRFGWAAAPLDAPGGPPLGPRPDSRWPERAEVTWLVVPGATYVFAAAPRDGAPRALRIAIDGGIVEVPFVDVRPDLPVVVAAYAFDEPAPFTIDVS